MSSKEKVLTYFHDFDRSNAFKYGLSNAHYRNLLVAEILTKDFKIEQLPSLEKQFEFIYDNFYEFKKIFREHISKDS